MFRIRAALEQRCDNGSYLGVVSTYSEITPNIIISGGGGSTGPTGPSGGGSGSTGPTGPSGGGGSSLIETISDFTGTSITPLGTTIFAGSFNNYMTSFLPNATAVGTIKSLELLSPANSPVNVLLDGGGQISVERNYIKRDLIYTTNGWKIQDPIFSSYFPSSNILSSFTGSIDPQSYDQFGASVSIDSKGTTAVIGAPYSTGPGDIGYIGSVSVITSLPDGVWKLDTEIVPTDFTGSSDQIRFGTTVAISGDGQTFIVGAPFDRTEDQNAPQGSTWVYKKVNNVWVEDTKLVGTFEIQSDYPTQGNSCDINYDGTVIVIGGANGDSDTQGGWIFMKIDGVWTETQNTFNSNPNILKNWCISSDASKIVVWGNNNGTQQHDFRVYEVIDQSQIPVQYVETFEHTETLEVPVPISYTTISDDGQTIAAGYLTVPTPFARSFGLASVQQEYGFIRIFKRVDINLWTNVNSIYVTNLDGNTDTGEFGKVLSISGDGNTIAIKRGSPSNSENSAVYIFTQTNGSWVLKNIYKTVPAVGYGTQFGSAISLSSDGKVLLTGAPSTSSESVFTSPGFIQIIS